MAKRTTNENFNVSYYCRDKNTNEDVKAVSMNWENRSLEEVRDNLNTWLTAVGYGNLVVTEGTTMVAREVTKGAK